MTATVRIERRRGGRDARRHPPRDRRLPARRAGPVPDSRRRVRGGRSSAFIVGVLHAEPARRGRARLRGRRPGGARARRAARRRGTRSCTSSRTARTASTGSLAQPWCDGRIGTYGTAYSASTALYLAATGREEVKALAVLGTGADIHDGWVYTSGAFELGWNVYWAYMTAAETIKRLDVDEEHAQRAAAGVRTRRSSRRLPSRRGCRSRITLCSTASARRSTASGSSTPTTTTTGRRSTSSRSPTGCGRRCSRSSGGTTTSSSRTSTSTARIARQAPHRLVVGPWEHTSYVSPFSTSRSGAVEFGPGGRLGRRALDAARARLVRPLADGCRIRRRRRRALLAAGGGRVARGRELAAAARRAALVSPLAAAAPTVATVTACSDAGSRLRRRAGGHLSLRPARPGPNGRRQDADADDHDRRASRISLQSRRGPTSSATRRRR